MNFKRTIFLVVIMVLLCACGGEGGSKDMIETDDNKSKNEIYEEHNHDEKRLFISKEITTQYQDITKEVSIITSTFKYNNKNLLIETTLKMHEYNKSEIVLVITIKFHYDNQDRIIGFSAIQENFIPNKPKITRHTSIKIKYMNNKIVENIHYTEGILSSKRIVTEWDGDNAIKYQNIEYSEDGNETSICNEINIYDGENIIHTELYENDGSLISTIDRVFDDKKSSQKEEYLIYRWNGKNNVVSETIVSPNRTVTIENKLKYNSYNMVIEEDSYRYHTSSSFDYVSREKTIIEYEER
jgi:hypothetical protein